MTRQPPSLAKLRGWEHLSLQPVVNDPKVSGPIIDSEIRASAKVVYASWGALCAT